MAYRDQLANGGVTGPTSRWELFKARHADAICFAVGFTLIALAYGAAYGVGALLHLGAVDGCGWSDHAPLVCYPILGLFTSLAAVLVGGLFMSCAHALGSAVLDKGCAARSEP